MGLTILVLAGLLVAFYYWQPQRIDLFPKPLPPQAAVDPAELGIFHPNARVLVITAHPDDDAFFLGGTLFKLHDAGATIEAIVTTDGDKGYYPFHDGAKEARVRQAEFMEATAMYGASEVVFFHLPDSRMGFSDALVGKIAERISAFKPTAILCFDPDYPWHIAHRDHTTSGEIVLAAAKRLGFKSWIALFGTRAPNCEVDVTAQWPREEQLIAVYRSQWTGARLARVAGWIRGRAQEEAGESRAVYVNSFRAIKLP